MITNYKFTGVIIMNRNEAWEKFISTGSVSDYLLYNELKINEFNHSINSHENDSINYATIDSTHTYYEHS